MSEDDWKYLCNYFASPKYQKMSIRNTENRAKQNTPHIAGTKSFARIRHEKKVGPIDLYMITRFNAKKKTWVNEDSRQKHEMMKQLQDESQVEGANPMAEEDICSQVLGQKSGYIRGRGPGPKPASSLSKQQDRADLEEYRRRAEQAEQENSQIKQQNMEIMQQMDEMKASQNRMDEMLRTLMEQLHNRGQILP